MIPQTPQEIVSQAIKYLYLSNKQLPQPIYHAVLSPYHQWSKSGHILGDAIAHLNFPDNSVLFISEIDSDDGIILPSLNSSIVLPHSPILTNKILTDNKIIHDIEKYVPNSKIANNTGIFEQQTAPYIGIPLIIEAARIRKRGIPLCTPLLIGKNCDRVKLTFVLQNLITKHGTGIIILNNSLISKEHNILKNISQSFIPEIFPLFLNQDVSGMTLMTYLAHKFNNQIEIINEWKFSNNKEIFNTFTLGISKNKNYNDINVYNITFRKKIWANVINSLKNKDYINIGYKSGVVVNIKDNEDKILLQKISLDFKYDLGESVWKISKNILNEIPGSDIDEYNLEIIPIINPESLFNYKNWNKINPEQYCIINETQNINVIESISKTINNYDINVDNSFIYKPLKFSLPLNIILLLHDINFEGV